MPQQLPKPKDIQIGIIGLGYVGLPLATLFGQQQDTLGFDINKKRIDDLKAGHDHTRQVTADELRAASRLQLTANLDELRDCNVYIVTVPTPVDKAKRPDMRPLTAASETVGQVIAPGDVVIYESTVYPGATEEDCVPLIERQSGLKMNRDFFVGYSPERVNPGDPAHGIADIVKVTSGSTPETAEFVDQLYSKIIRAGTHKAPSIRVAEAAKVIENTQRDVNIALVNELAILFQRMDIDTKDVLEAAGTKWNFLPFSPGLVGGHCVGVDPYYLTHKAQSIGHHAEMILAGRRTNDGMGAYIAERVMKLMTRKGLTRPDSRVLVLGATFKENCPDLRNSQVVEVLRTLRSFRVEVDIHDAWADPEEIEAEFGQTPVTEPETGGYDAVVLAVAHDEYLKRGADWITGLGRNGAVVYDVRSILPKESTDERL